MQRDLALTVLRFCAVLLAFFLARLCHGGNTISPGQALKGKDAIISSGGNFTLGFFSPPASSSNTTFASQKRYLGIWYTLIPEQTVVWVANRDDPVPATDAAGGSLEFSGNGDLVILDGKGRVLWKTNCSSTNDSIATLEDNGNLVLRSNSGGVIKWQSFDHPSDSLLSGMDITFDFEKGTGRLWTSWKSRTDPASGSFAFGADPKNVLQCILWNGSVPVWRTGQWTGRSFSGVPEMSNGYGWNGGFAFVPPQNENGTARFEYREPSSASSGYTRYVVEPDGRFALYSWDRKTGRWDQEWAAPVNACATYARCGPSSVCSEVGLRTEPACHCLPGFEPGGTGGCTRSVRLGCGSSRNDGFEKVASVRPPDGVLRLVQVTNGVEECRTYCWRNCSCMGFALVDEIGCMRWLEEDLVDMQQLAGGRGMDFYVRVAPEPVPSPSAKKHRNTLVITLSAAGSLGVISCLVCICLLWRRKARGLNGGILDRPFQYAGTAQEGRDSGLPLFDLKAIMDATDDFSTKNKLGEGGFGPVYKGVLAGGQEIAVKRLSKSSRQGSEEFMNEVEVIAKLQHKNLVRLLGCCVQGEEKMLVYEYMPNKSLDFLLFDPTVSAPLDWERRFQVVMGTARGLQYLHQESRLRVVHRDLKASNILLDEGMNPRISDFGLARIFGADDTQVNTNRIVGTYGYMSPEYALEGRFSTKSDVFSFGIIVLEIVSGQKMTSFRHQELSLNLLGYAWKLWREDRITDFLDPTLDGICNSDQVLRCIKVGLLCVQEGTEDRPSMSSVVVMLSGDSANLPQPKPPAYCLRTAPEDPEQARFPDNEDQICSANHVTVSAVEPR